MNNVLEVANNADMIINGYAFTKDDNNIRVLNLNNDEKSVYLDKNGEVLQTSMDDIEISIVKKYYEKIWFPKYYEFKVAGYYLYFTSYCIVECMHVHASDRKLTETGAAKFFVKDNGDSVLQNKGMLNDREIRKIQIFIKNNYQEMYLKWSSYSKEGFYEKQK